MGQWKMAHADGNSGFKKNQECNPMFSESSLFSLIFLLFGLAPTWSLLHAYSDQNQIKPGKGKKETTHTSSKDTKCWNNLAGQAASVENVERWHKRGNHLEDFHQELSEWNWEDCSSGCWLRIGGQIVSLYSEMIWWFKRKGENSKIKFCSPVTVFSDVAHYYSSRALIQK